MDRGFTIAFTGSLALHLGLLVAQLPHLGRLQPQKKQPPLEVIYESELTKEDVRRLSKQLAKAQRQRLGAPAPSEGLQPPQIRIPESLQLSPLQAVPEAASAERSAIVDLTNLAQASRGDPVLLSYFSAIREQIQRAANRRTWMTTDGQGGLIHISFVLSPAGRIRSVSVVGKRSVRSKTLRDIAMRIVQAAAPFPPFPPSLRDQRKTIIVPLEFLAGS